MQITIWQSRAITAKMLILPDYYLTKQKQLFSLLPSINSTKNTQSNHAKLRLAFSSGKYNKKVRGERFFRPSVIF